MTDNQVQIPHSIVTSIGSEARLDFWNVENPKDNSPKEKERYLRDFVVWLDKWIAKGYDPVLMIHPASGYAPILFTEVYRGNTDTVRYLLQRFGVLITNVVHDGQTPLIYAFDNILHTIGEQRKRILANILIMLEYGANPNVLNNDGQTLLYRANALQKTSRKYDYFYGDFSELIKSLISHGGVCRPTCE